MTRSSTTPGATPSAVRYKNWKIYFTMEGSTGASALQGPQTYGWAQVQNIRRDPFEQAVGEEQKSVLSMGGAIASPSTAYLYNWNMLLVGQQLWLKELESYIAFPPLQDPETIQPHSGFGAGEENEQPGSGQE